MELEQLERKIYMFLQHFANGFLLYVFMNFYLFYTVSSFPGI